MEGRLPRLLAAAAAAIAAVGIGFTAGAAASDSDPVAEMRRMHDEMHGPEMHGRHWDMGGDHGKRMDQMHAEMSARLSPADAELHDRMHAACAGDDERTT